MPLMVLKGEIILKEEPFVFVLKSSLRNEKCEFCLSPAELKCARCHYWRYCNRRCQKLAWTMHKLECDYLKKICPRNVPDSAHMLIRILLKQNTIDSKNHADESYEKKRPFENLMSHIAEIRNDQRRLEHFTSIVFVVQSFFETETLNEEYLLELFGKVCINSFNILDSNMNSVGTGIYLNASVLDHSCDPNAVAVFNGTVINIRSIKDIPDFHLNKVRISYIDILNLSFERKKELLSMYYFICDCERCVNETNNDVMQSMKCLRDGCSGFVPIVESSPKTNLTCNVCVMEVSKETLEEYHNVTEISDYHLQKMNSSNNAYIDVCEMMLSKQEKIFHDLNIRRIKMLDLAFEASINLKRWEAATEYGFQLLRGFRKYYGFYHPLVGLLNIKLLKLVLLQDDSERSIKLYEEAAEILSITHGTSHPLFKTLKEIMYG